MTHGSVFISYRRLDSKGVAQVIRDRLLQVMRPDQVFVDTTGLEPGGAYATVLEQRVRSCDVMIVLVDKGWAGDGDGRVFRLREPTDWVRYEVACALREGKPVVPVLIDGATLPPVEALPADLQALHRLQAFALRLTRLDADAWDLAGVVTRSFGGTWPPPEPGERVHALLAGVYAAFAGTMLLILLVAAAFVDKAPWFDRLSMAGLAAAIVIVLRLPLCDALRQLTRAQALEYAAAVHLACSGLMYLRSPGADIVGALIFGVLPAAVLYLGADSTRRQVRH
jgi:hypothetical protein